MLRIVGAFILANLALCLCGDEIPLEEQSKLLPLQASYKQINYHLCDNVDNDDIDANMQEAKRWYDEEVSKSTDDEMKKALEIFIAMTEPEYCTEKSYKVLQSNDWLDGYRAREAYRDDSLLVATRVDLLVNHFATEHAEKCREFFVKKLQEGYETMDKLSKKRAHKFADKLYLETDDKHRLNNLEHARVTYDVVKRLSADYPEGECLKGSPDRRVGRKILETEKVASLFNKYLVEPCQKLVDLSKGWWLPSGRKFDREWHVSDSLLDEFEERFGVCKSLVEVDREILEKNFIEESKIRIGLK